MKMAENDQPEPKNLNVLREKHGYPVYRHNPSVPDAGSISKRKKVRYGNEQKGFVLDTSSGEVLNVGGAGFYEYEEVDDTKFVKMFLAGIKQTAGLSKSGLSIFEIVYNQLQNNPSTDEVKLNYFLASEEIKDLNDRTFRRGIKELLDKEFIFRSPIDGIYFVNIRFMFNGDRLAFVKGYKRKSSSSNAQGQLDFGGEDESSEL